MVAQPLAQAFRPSTHSIGPNLGFSTSALWARFSVVNPGPAEVERWIAVDRVEVERLELYVDGQLTRAVGLATPQAERDLTRRWPAFRIVVPAHGELRIHLRATSQAELQLPVGLWAPRELAAFDLHVTLLVGLAHGVLIALALYNGFLYAFLRERAHLYYSLGVLSAMGWIACMDGTASLLLPAQWVASHVQNVVCGMVAGVFLTLFPRRLLSLREMHPRLDRMLLVGIAAVLVIDTAWLVGLCSYYTLNVLSIPVFVLIIGGFVAGGVLRMRAGFAPARYFVAAWSFFFAFSAVAVLFNEGVVLVVGPLLLPNLGHVVEAILNSLALANAAKRRNDEVVHLNAQLSEALDRIELLNRAKEHLAKFVPATVRKIVDSSPESPNLGAVDRDATILFLDIGGYTKLTEALDRDRVSFLVEKYFSAFIDDIYRNEGDINETAGDGLMIIFQSDGSPGHAHKAVRAAVAIKAKTAAINDELLEFGPIDVNIGINSGPVTLGSRKIEGLTGARWTYTATGLVTNVAARIGSHAVKGQVLVGPETAERVRGEFVLRDCGLGQFKNVSKPVPVFEVV